MPRSADIRVDPSPIIRAHWASLADARTGRPAWSDHFFFIGVPVFVTSFCLVWDVQIGNVASAALLTVSGLLGAFLFAVMLQIYGRAAGLADANREQGAMLSREASNLAELAANAGYAALICIVSAGMYVVAGVSSGWVARASSAIALGASTHLAFMLLMVMRRVYFRTTDSLNEARTGTGRGPRRRAA